jgi:hypothetical protein
MACDGGGQRKNTAGQLGHFELDSLSKQPITELFIHCQHMLPPITQKQIEPAVAHRILWRQMAARF